MTRRRWIADEYEPGAGRAVLTGEHAAHLARVLRAKIGQQFDLTLQQAGRSFVRTGTVTTIGQDRVEFALGDVVTSESENAKLALLLAIFKFDRMEWAVEKSVELGVARIVPVIARRSEKHLAAAAERRVERWRRIVKEAAEQSRRARLPEVLAPAKLKEALPPTDGLRLVLSEQRGALLTQVLEQHPGKNEIILAVGPEGGWAPEELDLFHSADFFSASLGQSILRAETAAIAALAIASAHLQDSSRG